MVGRDSCIQTRFVGNYRLTQYTEQLYMSRPRASYPAYRLHRASGQAVVTIAGSDRYLGLHNSRESRQVYDRLIREWVQAGRPRHSLRSDSLLVAELCVAF